MSNTQPIPGRGLYRDEFERDSCGFGLIANLDDHASHWLVETAITALSRLTHRGAVAEDGKTGDGCGLLLKKPVGFLRRVAQESGLELSDRFAAGIVFLSRFDEQADRARMALEQQVERAGLRVAGWRVMPTNPEACGEEALRSLPRMEMLFVNCLEEIDEAAKKGGLGVLAAGNLALTAVLLLKFATMAARYIPQYEVIDYAGAAKPDAPSGTARELAYRLGRVRPSELVVPIDQTIGPQQSRGASLGGCQVHSVRLPGYVASAEVIFGQPDMQLSMRHDAGAGAQPYIDGTLLAIRKVGGLKGLVRGLDAVLDEEKI